MKARNREPNSPAERMRFSCLFLYHYLLGTLEMRYYEASGGLNMPERSEDWLRQGESDLRHARNARDDGDYDWAAFASHQAAEKAIKALYQKLHLEAWGRVLSILLANLPEKARAEASMVDRAKELDNTTFPLGTPMASSGALPSTSTL